MNRGGAVVLIASLAFALAAAPALAAKSDDKDPELGKLKTATTATTSATTGIVTAVANCPGKSKVVGGGFQFQAPTTTDDFLNPLESRREGKKAWTVSAYRIDSDGAGPVMSLSAEAYCRTGLGKLSEKSAATTIVGINAGAPVATCPVKKAALSGGFSITGPSVPNAFHSVLYDNLMAGSVGWVMRATNLSVPPATTTFTSFVYCQKKGEKAPKETTGAGVIPAGPPIIAGSADTAECRGKRDAFVGGFQVPPFISAPSGLPLVTESRHVGKGWHVAAVRLTGTGATSLAAHGYCS